MKKKFYLLLILLLCSFFVLNLNGNSVVLAESSNLKKFTLYGKGEVSILADEAVVNFGVQTLNENATTAQKENAEIISKLIEVLKENDVLEKDIQTTNFSVCEKYDYSCENEIKTFQASTYLEFKTGDIENLSTLLSTLTENGANFFSGISFCLKDGEKSYNEALNLALTNAKNKLQNLGESLENFKIAEICEEQCYNSYSCFLRGTNATESANFIEKGEIKVSACVKVVFESADGDL